MEKDSHRRMRSIPGYTVQYGPFSYCTEIECFVIVPSKQIWYNLSAAPDANIVRVIMNEDAPTLYTCKG